jgi:hypothetical protein
VLFPLKFSTLNTSHHTPFCVSQSPHSLLLSHSFVAMKQEIYCTVSYTGEPKSLCSSTTETLHCANTVHVPQKWLNDPKVTQSQYLQTPYSQQLCCTPIHWYSHSNRNPTTDSWTINFLSPCTSDSHHCTQYFPHPVPQTHITVHNACYSKNIVINL